MNIKQAVYSHLAAFAGFVALLGDRIYPMILPQKPVLPAITYSVISDVPERDLSGVSRRRARVQLSCWAKTYKEAEQVAAQVRAALQDYTGQMGGAAGPRILDCNVIDNADSVDQQLGVYHVPVDAIILYKGGS